MLREDFQVSSEKDSDSLPESSVDIVQRPEGVPGDRSPAWRPGQAPWTAGERAGPARAAHVSLTWR